MDNYRMVGCVCAEEDTNIKWTWLSEVFVVVLQLVCTKVLLEYMFSSKLYSVHITSDIKLCGYSDNLNSLQVLHMIILIVCRVPQRGVSADSGWS